MHKTCLIMSVLTLGCTGYATATEDTLQLKLEPDQTQTTNLTKQQTLIVEIPANLTTGYRWEINQLTRERRCYLFSELDAEAEPKSSFQPVRPGAPTVQKWSIKMDPSFPCANAQLIEWIYRRSWEPLNALDHKARLIIEPAP